MAAPPDKPDLSRLKLDHDAPQVDASAGARPPFFWIIAAAAVSAALTWLIAGRGDEPAPAAKPSASVPAAPVTAQAQVLNATGYVVAQRQAAVSSKATGRLKVLNVKEGDTVTAGQVIGVLENDDLAQAMARQQAVLEAAKTRVHSAEAELAVAELEQGRTERLVKSSAVSESERDAAKARYLRAAADVAQEQANVNVAAAALKEAEVNLEYTLIRAPFDGTVLTKNADIGEVVAPFGSSSDARAAVVTIADMSSLQVEADVAESNLAKVFVGQRCRIKLDSFPDKPYQGMVDSIVPTVDRAKATVLVKIKFLDKDSRVIPEMSAKVEFALEKGRPS